jgi:hypothetical protein
VREKALILTHFIALGLVGSLPPAQVNTITAVAERTVTPARIPVGTAGTAEIPVGASRFAAPMDPADRFPHAFAFGQFLGENEKIVSIERLTMSAAGASLGVQIDQSTSRAPIIGTDGKAIQLWFFCTEEFQAHPAFSGNGVQIAVSALVRTDAVPFHQLERTAVLTVRQQ